jgi:hypothetical protein
MKTKIVTFLVAAGRIGPVASASHPAPDYGPFIIRAIERCAN